MSELESIPPVTEAAPGDSGKPIVWPEAPAVEGVVYGFMDPNHGDKVPMVAMSYSTWMKFSQQLTALKSRLEILSQENIEMKKGRHPDAPRIVLPGR